MIEEKVRECVEKSLFDVFSVELTPEAEYITAALLERFEIREKVNISPSLIGKNPAETSFATPSAGVIEWQEAQEKEEFNARDSRRRGNGSGL